MRPEGECRPHPNPAEVGMRGLAHTWGQGSSPLAHLLHFQEGNRQERAWEGRGTSGSNSQLATPWGGSLHGSEQWWGVVRDVVQVGTDIEAVNHVVGVPLPGHPKMGSRGTRSLGSQLPRTQSPYSLPPQVWKPGPWPPTIPMPWPSPLSLLCYKPPEIHTQVPGLNRETGGPILRTRHYQGT